MERAGFQEETYVTDGLAQSERLPAALADGYFRVDERDFATLVATVADMGYAIPFAGAGTGGPTSWGSLLEHEPAILMARILAEPIGLRERRFLALLERDPSGAAAEAMSLALLLDRWREDLCRSARPSEVNLGQRLERLISEELAPKVQPVLASALGPRVAGALGPADLSAVWRMPVAAEAGADGLRETLRRSYEELLNGVAYLQRVTATVFADRLSRADVEPANALILAFLQLLGDVQKRFNGLTSRHNDFFYQAVLGTAVRARQPDTVMLSLPDAAPAVTVPVPLGTRLLGTYRDGRTPVSFRTNADAYASSARLRGLRTLYFERDPLVSPAREFDFVTRTRTIDVPIEPSGRVRQPSWALFGGDVAAHEHADFGLCITSPCLLLREGRRRIAFELVLRLPAGARDPDDAAARNDLAAAFARRLRADAPLANAVALPGETLAGTVARVLAEGGSELIADDAVLLPGDPVTAALLRRLIAVARPDDHRAVTVPLGRLAAHVLLSPEHALPEHLVRWLSLCARRVFGEASTEVESQTLRRDRDPVFMFFSESRAYQFETYLSSAFSLELTTADGWYEVGGFAVSNLADADANHPTGLKVTCVLRHDAPPIEPSPSAAAELGRPPVAPMARLRLAEDATFCAHTLFEPFVLEQVGVDVAVTGLRTLRVSNDLGPLDPSAPFQPFGPTPLPGAALMVGAWEAALKPLRSMRLNLTWTGLPRAFGGFAAHYAGYGDGFDSEPFRVMRSWLVDSDWRPTGQHAEPLFAEVSEVERLPSTSSVVIDVPATARPLPPDLAEAQFGYGVRARAGFARLVLEGPALGFGHGAYPTLYARAIAATLRRKRAPNPPPPYTPTLARLVLDYEARSVIHVGGGDVEQARARAEYLDHIGPFAVEQVYPEPLRPGPGLLPARMFDGSLHIGVDRLAPGEPVTLLFDTAERARRRRGFDPPRLHWSYLGARGWLPLAAERIVADTTSGLMRSGLISINVPEDATRSGRGVAAGAIWLRVAADARINAFPRLRAVMVNGLIATETAERTEPLPPNLDWRLAEPIAGLETIRLVGTPFGGVAAETTPAYRARVSERLRHKGRAVTARDYERLVLERFEQVWKVKCFPALDTGQDRPAPGHVLVVVVPHAAATDADRFYEARMFDVLSLRRIRDALETLAAPGVRIAVQNPAYDYLQVRCRVGLSADIDRGRLLRTLASDVAAYLTPWGGEGPTPGFGWQIAADEVEAFIASREGVASVGEFAMLMLTNDDQGCYGLVDTARSPSDPYNAQRKVDVLRHSVPWSLPLPFRRQALRTSVPTTPEAAMPAGIGDLEVGGTLVVTGTGR